MGIIVYGINDITDLKSDRLNKQKGGLQGALIKENEKKHIIFSVGAVSAFFLALFYMTNNLMAVSVAGIIIFSLVYSVRPIRLKSIPFLDSASNALWFILIFLLGRSYSGQYSVPLPVLLVGAGAAAAHALFTLRDLEPDKKSGDLTTGLFLGERKTLLLSFTIFSLIFILIKFNYAVAFYLVICMACCIIMMLDIRKSIKKACLWIIVYGFPALCIYLLFITPEYALSLVT